MKTALITGASGGIGLELAKIFAAQQINLVIAARSETKLNELKNALSQYKVNIHVVAIDLSQPESAQTLFTYCNTNNLQIDYLINNAGFGDFGKFHEAKWQKQQEIWKLKTRSWRLKNR